MYSLKWVCHKYFRIFQVLSAKRKMAKELHKRAPHHRFSCHSTYSEGQPPQKRKVFQHKRTRRWFFKHVFFTPTWRNEAIWLLFQMGLKSPTRFSQIIGPQHHPKNDLFIGWRKEWWFANGVHHRAWMLVFWAMIRSFHSWFFAACRDPKLNLSQRFEGISVFHVNLRCPLPNATFFPREIRPY